ncbi:inner centromere protein A isoform X3 [Electrophorus electricus]|uniref:inner centromere protein A isoform X3 n=1 Tax=Electrophorus electricus TaxID=8005 RepID=UPI0015CF8524|nr:inner centromere protein A isoform X3 [Electrophorus electricus]
MSSLLEATRSLMHVFDGKLQEFTDEIDNVHMVWLKEIQQEAQRMFSSDFSTEPELMPKTPSQKRTTRRKRVSMELTEARSKRRFSKGKRSNLRRSSIQTTLNSISELVITHDSSNGSEATPEEPGPRTRRNKAAAVESEPVKRSTRARRGAKAKEQSEVVEEQLAAVAASPQPPVDSEDLLEEKAEMKKHCEGEEKISSSSLAKIAMSPAVVESPRAECRSAEMLLQSVCSPGRSANKIAIAAAMSQGSLQTSTRRSQVVRCSLVVLRHSMTQEAVRRASRRSFLRKKARMGNSTCSSSISADVSMDVETEETDAVENMEQVDTEEAPAELAAELSTGAQKPQPEELEPKKPVEEEAEVQRVEEKPVSPSLHENCRFTRSMARPSVSDDSGKKSQDDNCASRSGSKRRAAVAAAEALRTPTKRLSPPKKCMTSFTPGMRSFLHTVQKNQLLMMTPSSLGRASVMKSFIKQPAKTDVKERERQKWDALNKKIEQENERKKKVEEEKRKKQEEMKRKRDERLRRVVEARVKEKEKEQEKKKKFEEKMAQLEKKSDMLRVERLAEEKAKKKVASKRQEELELRRKQEEAARKKKLQQAEEEERRHQELLAKRRAEEERERARKHAEATRALELRKEQEQERERERLRQEREKAREKQAAAERERMEQEKAIALQKELERAAREKERRELEEKRRREEEQRRAEEESAAKQKQAAATAVLPTVTSTLVKMPTSKTLNATITHSPVLNVTVDIESITNTPVNKGTAHNMTMDMGTGLNCTVDVEHSPQSYQITPKGKKIEVLVNPDDYGMDQNSDDSTDDESAPRKPIPSWAEGMQLQQAIKDAYFDPLDLHSFFGEVEQPKLEEIFQRSKPRFFKRTSSAVWHSPPRMGAMH